MDAKIEAGKTENEKVISIVIPKEEVQTEFDKILTNVKKDVNIEGFRKGKVPANIIMSRYGESMIMEASEKLISQSLHKACIDNKINPAGDPIFEDVKVNTKEVSEVSFKAIVELDPEIEVKGYKDLKVNIEEVKVDDAEIDAIMESIKNQRAELHETEAPIKKGDIVALKYENAKVNGEVTENFPAPKMIDVGNAPLAELNTDVLGLKNGDKKKVSFVLPDGKKAVAEVVVENVRAKTLLPLDEEFFAQMGVPAKNEEELKAIVKDNVLNKKKNEAKESAIEKATEELLKKNEFFVPQGRINYYIQNLYKNEEKYYNAKNPQPSFEEYLKTRREDAIKNIRRFRILDWIVSKEDIKVSAAEVDTYIENIAKAYNYPFEEFKEQLRKSGETLNIREEMKISKALDCLVGVAKWEDASK